MHEQPSNSGAARIDATPGGQSPRPIPLPLPLVRPSAPAGDAEDFDTPICVMTAEIAEQVARIRAIPERELPDPEARAALIALAEGGAELSVYRPVGAFGYTIWLRPERPDLDGRLSCTAWMRVYRQRADERALRALLPSLWRRRAEHLRLAQFLLMGDGSAGADATATAMPASRIEDVERELRDLEARVNVVRWRMIQAEGPRGLARYHTICDTVAQVDPDAQATFTGLECRDGQGQGGEGGEER